MMPISAPFVTMSSSPLEDGSGMLLDSQGRNASIIRGIASNHGTENFFGVIDLENKEDNKDRCLIFRLRVPFENTFKEIEFEFDLVEDDPQIVVAEMNEVEELMFVSDYADQIVQSITPVVEMARKVARDKERYIRNSGDSSKQLPLSDLVIETFLANPGEVHDSRSLTAPGHDAEERIRSDSGDGRVIRNITIEANSQHQQLPFQHGQTDGTGLHSRELLEQHGDIGVMRASSDSRILYGPEGTDDFCFRR
jgi:hypothetical protein